MAQRDMTSELDDMQRSNDAALRVFSTYQGVPNAALQFGQLFGSPWLYLRMPDETSPQDFSKA